MSIKKVPSPLFATARLAESLLVDSNAMFALLLVASLKLKSLKCVHRIWNVFLLSQKARGEKEGKEETDPCPARIVHSSLHFHFEKERVDRFEQ